jgi:hypothetical protein
MRAAIPAAILLSCSITKVAVASCEDDLAAARAATLAAGPVRVDERVQQYDTAGKPAEASTFVRDIVPPDRLRIISIPENGATSVTLLVRGSAWTAALGEAWKALDAAATKPSLDFMTTFPWPADAKQVSCAAEHDDSGRETTEFNFSITAGDSTTTYAVMVEPGAKRTSRTTLTLSKAGARISETNRAFEYDVRINIEPPKQ